MRIIWKHVMIFGTMVQTPRLCFLVEKDPEYVTEFQGHAQELATCDRCHKLFDCRAGVRLIMHIQKDHKFEEEQSIEIVSDLYRHFFVLRYKKGVKKNGNPETKNS